MNSRRRVKALVGILFRMLLRADGTSEIRTADPETLYHLGHWSEDLVQRGVWKPLPPEGPPFPSYRGHPQGVFTGPWVLGRVLIRSNQPRIRCDYRTPPHVPAEYLPLLDLQLLRLLQVTKANKNMVPEGPIYHFVGTFQHLLHQGFGAGRTKC